MSLRAAIVFAGLVWAGLVDVQAQVTPPGGWGPGNCVLTTPVCAYTKTSKGVPIPDTSCLGSPVNSGYANGPASPNPETQGVLNDGPHCGASKTTLQPCGDYLTKTPGCTGDLSICDPVSDPSCSFCDPSFQDCNGGGSPDPGCDPENPCLDSDQGTQAAVHAALGRIAAQGVPQAIRGAIRQLAGFGSVHLKARVLLSEAPNVLPLNLAGTTGTSTFTELEYWEQGNRYRSHTFVDPKMGLVQVTDTAFDGRQYQQVMQEGQGSRLSLTPWDDRSEFLPVANPLFLPFAFLSPQDDTSCALCALRLADFAFLESQLALRPDGKGGGAPVAAFAMAGGLSGGRKTSHRIELDETGRVSRLRTISDSGSTLADVRFYDYQTAAGTRFFFPRKIELAKSLDGAKSPWLNIRYVIDQLDFNQPIDVSRFTIPVDAMDTVVDSKKGFLKWKRVDRKEFCSFPGQEGRQRGSIP